MNDLIVRDPSSAAVDPSPTAAPVPRTFFEYLRSFGPGLVIVLTWLGAGDNWAASSCVVVLPHDQSR
jgi:hypothetical protein